MKLVLYIPYLFWILITLILIRGGFIGHPPSFIVYIGVSFIIALTLELYRNRTWGVGPEMKSRRWAAYFISNVVMGIPLFEIILVDMVVLAVNPVIIMSSGSVQEMTVITQTAWAGYLAVWFAVNAAILRIHNLKKTVLLLVSPIIMLGASRVIHSAIFWIVTMSSATG